MKYAWQGSGLAIGSSPRFAPGVRTHPRNFVMAGLLSRPPMKTLLPRRNEFPRPHCHAQVFMGRRDVKLVLRPRFARTGGPGDDESREIGMCACPGREAQARNPIQLRCVNRVAREGGKKEGGRSRPLPASGNFLINP